jgi:hypothetical protein
MDFINFHIIKSGETTEPFSPYLVYNFFTLNCFGEVLVKFLGGLQYAKKWFYVD